MTRRGCAIALLGLLAAGCQVLAGYEDFTGPTGEVPAQGGASGGGAGGASGGGGAGAAGGGSAGASDGGSGGDAGQAGAGDECAKSKPPGKVIEGRGPAMVSTRIGDFDLGTKKFTATSCAWVDKTEVTFAQYGEFLKDKGAGGGNPTGGDTSIDGCSWNTDATPGKDCLDTELPLQEPGYPVVCIDQCDAAAFCRWAGKELCGGGTQNSPYLNPSFTACTSEGKFSLPYGNLSAGDSKSGKCNDQSYSNKDPACVKTPNGVCALQAGTLPSCTTATGVADLVGNVYEWTAGCDQSSGQSDQCEVLGGSFNTGLLEAQCDKVIQQPRDARRADIGFRCCALGAGNLRLQPPFDSPRATC